MPTEKYVHHIDALNTPVEVPDITALQKCVDTTAASLQLCLNTVARIDNKIQIIQNEVTDKVEQLQRYQTALHPLWVNLWKRPSKCAQHNNMDQS